VQGGKIKQKAESRKQRVESRKQKSRKRKAEGRKQRAESRRQKAEGRKQKAEDRSGEQRREGPALQNGHSMLYPYTNRSQKGAAVLRPYKGEKARSRRYEEQMPGFPTTAVGTPTNRGKARRYMKTS